MDLYIFSAQILRGDQVPGENPKYFWISVSELSVLTKNRTRSMGGHVVIDMVKIQLEFTDQRRCLVEVMLLLQMATRGAYSNPSKTLKSFILPVSLLRLVTRLIFR